MITIKQSRLIFALACIALVTPIIARTKRDINAQDKEGMTALMRAVKENKLKKVRKLIKKGADVNIKDHIPGGKTALMFAAENGNLAIVQKLIKAGAHVNAVYGGDFPHAGKPVLRYAIDSGSVPVVQTLLKAGADPNAFTNARSLSEKDLPKIEQIKPYARNHPLLTYAITRNASLEMIKALIEGGADVNKKSLVIDWTPLMIAAYLGKTEVARELIQAGADINAVNKKDKNKTALDYAREHGINNFLAVFK